MIAPEVPVDFFCESVLPAIPADLLRDVTAEIEDKYSVEDRWRGFETNPYATSGHEEEVYRPLTKIIDTIWDAGKKSGGADLFCRFEGSRAPAGERTDDSRPDGYGVRREPENG